jgi:hypothetical protein
MTSPRKQSRWRRRAVVLIALSIVLGFLTTWAVAWGLVMWLPPDGPIPPSYGVFEETRVARLGNTRIGGISYFEASYNTVYVSPFIRPSTGEATPDGIPERFVSPPAWSLTRASWMARDPVPEPVREILEARQEAQHQAGRTPVVLVSWEERCCGWPCRCLRAWTADLCEHWHGAVSGPTWLIRAPVGASRPLPYVPWWPGLIANTLFFTAPWFLLLFGVGVARCRWRMRRGSCPSCKYDLRGDLDAGCPECGWGRVETKTQAASRGGEAR